MIIDANVILRAFFPDEAQTRAQSVIGEHAAGRIVLKAPALLLYELNNAIWQAERRRRITQLQADQMLQAISGLDIMVIPQSWGGLLPLARQYDRSAYDAAYLALAQETGEPLLTGDLRLYNAVHTDLEWVLWIEDYPLAP
jgi:predicted nucleic acid-binding protein